MNNFYFCYLKDVWNLVIKMIMQKFFKDLPKINFYSNFCIKEIML